MPTNKPGKLEEDQGGTAFIRALRDTFDCGIALAASNDGLLTLNPEAAKMLGFAAGTGSATVQQLPELVRQAVQELIISGSPGGFRQIELKIPGRGSVTLHLSTLRAAQKDSKGVALVLRDLTPLRNIERKVWRLDRLASVGTLSASMAHEIKNAMVAGKTFMDLLLEKHPEADLVDVVRREMGRIDSIVNRMLGFVGPARAAFARVNVHESLDHSLRLVQPQLESKTIALSRSFRATPEVVNGDDHELQQAFVNLFLNALEAMGTNGTLTVATENLGGETRQNGFPNSSARHVRVTINDTGPGIAQRDMEHLFEPFFTTKSAGTGLGLPITQRIIREHRGDIEVASQPGQGTTFTITLPLLGST
jgi:two-component system sensor histidine kinase HydH